MRTTKYDYNVGQIISDGRHNFVVCEQIRMPPYNRKGYKCHCNKCGQRFDIEENKSRYGAGCPYCAPAIKRIVVGLNDFATTHPHFVQFFVNQEEAKSTSFGSHKSFLMQCPNCGTVRHRSPNKLHREGLGCKACGDGVSYAEKFVFKVLQEAGIQFETQFSPKWAGDKRYDFYIPHLNIIIETHGYQHYKETKNGAWGLLEEIQANDNKKQKLAMENVLSTEEDYIVLDCSHSDAGWIESQILDSRLSQLFPSIKETDWEVCHLFATSSLMKQSCDRWNEEVHTTQQIADELNLSRTTIRRYLKQGTALGWCNYNPQQEAKRIIEFNAKKKSYPIKCMETGIGYDSISQCARNAKRDLGVSMNSTGIRKVLNGEREHYKGFHFTRV